MDRAVFAMEASATLPVGQLQLPLYTYLRPMDRAVFVIAATASHQGGHFEQHLNKPLRAMDMAVFAIAATATHIEAASAHTNPSHGQGGDCDRAQRKICKWPPEAALRQTLSTWPR